MRITLVLSTIFLFNIIYAQQPNTEWAKSFGGSGYDGAYLVKEDQDGNIYTCGWFSTDTVDFDPGIDTFNIVSQGGQDAFLQKLDANGNFLWAISLGSTGTDQIRAMVIDNDNNVIVSNMFAGTVDFDPGPGTYNLTSNGGQDVFVAKFSPNGNLLWAKSFGSSTSSDKCYAVTTDSLNNVYLAGHFGGNVDFDPGPGMYNLSSSGNDDSFISKLDVNGNFVWAKKFGSSGIDQLYGIIYYDNFIYSTGYYNYSASYSRIFHCKVKAQDGSTSWIKQIGPSTSTGLSGGLSLDNDSEGNIYITGVYLGTIDFDPGIGTELHTSNDATDIFVQKFDTLGNMLWTETMGSVGQDYGQGITHLNGELYLTGIISDTVDIDVSANTNYLASNGNYDIFIAKYDTSFNLIWGENYGNAGSDAGFGIEVNNASEIYVAGWFNDTVDFDNSINVIQTESNGSEDIFVIKLNGCPPSIGSQTVTECDSYTWPADGNTYGSTGTYNATLTNAAGCDSLVTLNLTITSSNTGSETVTECDSYIWTANGNTYTTTGTYNTTLTNAAGCDSVVTLNLTIINSNMGSETVTECDSYTWPADGNTYNSTGTYTTTLTNAVGCDSVVTLNLTINSVSDLTTSTSGITISANNANASYIWLDCDNGYSVIPGESNQSYTPSVNGNYAVELTENGCADTSACVTITTVGIIENSFIEEFTLYPNPTDGLFSIQFNSSQEHITLSIMDASGKLIDTKNYKQVDLIEYELNQPKGIYLIELSEGENQRSLIRLIKQ